VTTNLSSDDHQREEDTLTPGWNRRAVSRGGRKLLEKLPMDTDVALDAAARIDAAIRPDFRRALFYGVSAIIVLAVGSTIGDGLHSRALHTKLAVIGLAVAFVIFGVLAVRSSGNEVRRVISARGGPAAGTTVRLLITLFGYLIILLSTLGMLAVPLGHLLVGGAITGVVVGIAAQQSLGNIFAGLMLLLARPYVIGDEVRIRSGAMGGPIDGTVVGMDLLYTTVETDEGPVRLPNSGLLASAVGPRPPKDDPGFEQAATDREPAGPDSTNS
jgi:small-conductance mechanosensitive channel